MRFVGNRKYPIFINRALAHELIRIHRKHPEKSYEEIIIGILESALLEDNDGYLDDIVEGHIKNGMGTMFDINNRHAKVEFRTDDDDEFDIFCSKIMLLQHYLHVRSENKEK